MTDYPVIAIDNIGEYNKLYGFKTLHPLVNVVNIAEATRPVPDHVRFRYGVYALWLKNGQICSLHYGRQPYDYQDGTIVSFAPGQTVTVDRNEGAPQPAEGIPGLLFHPDLISGTALGKTIADYHFFDYDSTESLHLSEQERKMFTDILNSIRYELEQGIDAHSEVILTDRIKLILDYCQRFYDRQFITRHKANSEVMARFDHDIRDYFARGEGLRRGLPFVNFFADRACLSPGYFGDLVRKESGMSAKLYIQQHVLSLSKQLLQDGKRNITQVSDFLGFKYPQHFTRFFKKMSGMTPKEYIKA
jgi:AraC-like DNA-binding protein